MRGAGSLRIWTVLAKVGPYILILTRKSEEILLQNFCKEDKVRLKIFTIQQSDIYFLREFEYNNVLLKFHLKEQLRLICKEYHARAAKIENLKYDLEHEVVIKDYEVMLAPGFQEVLHPNHCEEN